MKKLVALICTLALCLSLLSCVLQEESTSEESASSLDSNSQNTDTSSTESESEENTESDSESDSSSESEAVDEDKAYLEIPRFIPSGYKKCSFAIENSSYVLKLEIPFEWNISTESGGYKIIRGGKQIGSIMLDEASDAAQWKAVSTRQKEKDYVTVVETIEKRGTDDTLEFRYRWQYNYTEGENSKQIYIYASCPEVYQLVSYRMYSGSTLKPLESNPNLGILPSSLDGTRMLVLGNSFVGTSNIGNILQDLFNCNGKENTVTPMSIGMGNIGKYAIDEGLLNTIKSGEYDVLFISGFYTSDDTMSLKIFQEACNIGDVTLVVMPAHNEVLASAVNSAKACELPIINWKGELDELLDSGIDKSYLCINDSYSHSTPLAGYVGAHMIYRAIYGEAPKNPGTILSESELSVLGDYSSTGIFYSTNPAAINYIK